MQIKSILKNRSLIILDNIDLTIKRSEVIGLVGESGSGKSMLGCAILDMVPSGCSITSGSIVPYFETTKTTSGVTNQIEAEPKQHFYNKWKTKLKNF